MGSCCYEQFATPVFNQEARKAAKEYCCSECGIKIQKGDQYERISMLQEGQWFDYKTCEKCADLRESLSDVDCPYYEGLSECYTEHLREEGLMNGIKKGSHAARLVPSYWIEE